MYQVPAYGMSPCDVAPFQAGGIMLEEEVVFSVMKYTPVWIVNPAFSCREMKLRPVPFPVIDHISHAYPFCCLYYKMPGRLNQCVKVSGENLILSCQRFKGHNSTDNTLFLLRLSIFSNVVNSVLSDWVYFCRGRKKLL